MIRLAAVALVGLLAFPIVVVAQESRVYVGGTFNVVTQTHADDEPLGGTTWGGSALFGVRVSPRLAVEFEPSLGGTYSWEYTYRPSPSLIAHVIARRRNTFFSGQARIHLGVLEPVVGMSYVHGRIGRHATIGSSTYFDDSGSADTLAVVGGVDAALKLASHFYFVPTFRVIVSALRPSIDPFGDPLGDQTRTGPLAFRYGAGVRLTF
jgi:hypothetical protein